MGMEADDLPCSRNARPPKALVGRAQWKILERLRLADSECQLSEIQRSFVFALVGSSPTAVHYARRWGL